jgi:hypothetical protein
MVGRKSGGSDNTALWAAIVVVGVLAGPTGSVLTATVVRPSAGTVPQASGPVEPRIE